MMKRRLKYLVEGILILIAFGAALFSQRVFIADWIRLQQAPRLPEAVSFETFVPDELPVLEPESRVIEAPVQPVTEPEVSSEEDGIPDIPVVSSTPPAPIAPSPEEINLAVPFTSQAPFADWSEPYKEACEEASLYMVHLFFSEQIKGEIPAQTAKEALDKIVVFEKELFGYYEDTTAQETAMVAKKLYGYERVEVIEEPTIELFKEHLIAGRPILIPAAGRLLGNPYFHQPGPLYHMLVIRGFTKQGQFITNDPGTRHGEAYVYDADTLMNAMHDWNQGNDMQEGAKRAIVIYP